MPLPFPDPEEEAPLSLEAPMIPAEIPAVAAPVESSRLNYFNYYTEVEEFFVARRGSPMMISPLDWSLVESWKEAGIPLAVILRGITRAFEKRTREVESSSIRKAFKKVNTLFYCQQSVMEEYATHLETHVGESPSGDASTQEETELSEAQAAENDLFPPATVRRYLEEVSAELEHTRQAVQFHATEMYPHTRWVETIDRAIAHLAELMGELPKPGEPRRTPINFEKMEQDLTWIEELLYTALCADAPPEVLTEATTEAVSQLKPHKKRMDAAVYQQTLENYRARQLRTRYQVPRLSLFYLRPE